MRPKSVSELTQSIKEGFLDKKRKGRDSQFSVRVSKGAHTH